MDNTLDIMEKILTNSAERERIIRKYSASFYNNEMIDRCYAYIFRKLGSKIIQNLNTDNLPREINKVTVKQWHDALFEDDDAVWNVRRIFRDGSGRDDLYLYCFAKLVEKNRGLFVNAESGKSNLFYTIGEEQQNHGDTAHVQEAEEACENPPIAQQEKKSLKLENDRLLLLITKKDGMIDDLNNEVKGLKARLSSLQYQVDDSHKKQIEDLKQKIANMREGMNYSLEEKENEIISLNKAFAEEKRLLEQEKAYLQNMVEQLKSSSQGGSTEENAQLKTEIDHLKQKIESMREGMQFFRTESEAEKRSLQSDNDRLSTKVRELEERLASTQANTQAASNEDSLKNKIASLEAELLRSNDKIERLRLANESMRMQIDEAEED